MSSLDQVTPGTAAYLLHSAGVRPAAVVSDTRLAEHLVIAFHERRLRLARAPQDFGAVRAELAALARGEARP